MGMTETGKHQESINLSAFRQQQTNTSPIFQFVFNHLILCILGAVFVFILLSQFLVALPGGSYILLFLIFGFAIWIKVVLPTYNKGKPDTTLIEFVHDNHFQLVDVTNHKNDGAIFRAGNHDNQLFHGFSGEQYSYPFLMYQHLFSKGSGRSASDYFYLIAEISLPKLLPHIFIDNRGNNSFLAPEILDVYNDNQLMKLEGNFSKQFNVYGVPGYEVELLTLLNPAFMSALMDFEQLFDLEFLDDKAYIYLSDQFVYSEQSIKQIFSVMEFVILELQKQMDTFTFDPGRNRPKLHKVSMLQNFLKSP
jgi:hypothetical protein